MRQTIDPLAAEARAIEAGLQARSNGDGTFRVRSSSRDLNWTVRVGMVRQWAVEGDTQREVWVLKFTCDCEAGNARPAEAVGCLHAACVGRSLERRGLARWFGGVWEASEKLRSVA